MIITKLQGGIGNQMFQYAAGKRLAVLNGSELKLDVSWYANVDEKYRKFELDRFNISAKAASKKEIDRFRPTFFNKPIMALTGRTYAAEKHFHFDPNILSLKDESFLVGYWQSEKYFSEIADTLRQEFTLKEDPDDRYEALQKSISESESVSLHVRRGDYLDPQYKRVFAECSPPYYASAVEIISKETAQPSFFVFSDDMEWTRANIPIRGNVTYVSGTGFSPEEELLLMARCRRHIMANSSFSWWGSWLGAEKDGSVIAPKRWFENETTNTNDLIPPTWKKI